LAFVIVALNDHTGDVIQVGAAQVVHWLDAFQAKVFFFLRDKQKFWYTQTQQASKV
jgi:hypothetical protein